MPTTGPNVLVRPRALGAAWVFLCVKETNVSDFLMAIIADVQLGNHKRFGGPTIGSMNDRARLILGVLTKTCDRVLERRCTDLLVAGDLFDYARPEAAIIAAVQTQTARLRNEGVQVWLLPGNHDRASMHPGDSALSPLAPLGTVLERPARLYPRPSWELLAVPFWPGDVTEWLERELDALPPPTDHPVARLLALHMGIKDEKTPPWLQASKGAIALEHLQRVVQKYDVHAVVAGDWHSRRSWCLEFGGRKVPVLQVGALVPTGWDNPGLTGYGTLAFWDGRRLTMEEIDGPRFVHVRTESERDDMAKASASPLFVSHLTDPDEMGASRQFWDAVHATTPLGGYEVLPDERFAKAQARQAAQVASDATTVQEALAAFVQTMPLKESVDRASVLEKAREYLK